MARLVLYVVVRIARLIQRRQKLPRYLGEDCVSLFESHRLTLSAKLKTYACRTSQGYVEFLNE